MKPKLVFTGGGTAGHVTPNLALIDGLSADFEMAYMGSMHGVEHQIITDKKIAYYAVRSGKLRRYFSWKNFKDPFNLVIGVIQSAFILRRLKPRLVFSKGGFVALPVVIGAWLNRIPVVAHESDLTPGLANRLSFPFVSKVCVTFDAGKKYFKNQKKVCVTGTPIRTELFQGSREAGLAQCEFDGGKPCLLVMGGSQGAGVLNRCAREQLKLLCTRFHVIHLCGKNKIDAGLLTHPDYYQLEYATDNLPDLFAASDVVLSRAGANALYEILALAKPHVLVPLSHRYSRGDQVDNARYFQTKGVSTVLDDTGDLSSSAVCDAVNAVYAEQESIITKIKALNIQSATPILLDLIKQIAGSKKQ
ncbi:MAG: undecaprenyldiphospho-muramoylpentapeptide beta-N-acetylglucosaminyltransferase [Gammaproteobacteria bacterium]|nr:undecaprenyldiphospho-muramoylpentapeptide beta-N-acetylglucosaminyltransferase [Gammaproteobacteria bacterium]